MKLLPTELIIYKTHLSVSEVINTLAENVEPVKYRFFSNNPSRIYEGNIQGNIFKINRIIGYRNSFLPRINGVVSGELDGTAVKVKMNIHPAAAVFIAVFFSFFLFGWMIALASAILNGKFEIGLLFGIVLILFPYALTMGGFKFESLKTKENLKELFQAKIISD